MQNGRFWILGNWSANGRLQWPWGSDYERPQSIRICYPTVALKDGAAYFCGVSDILEPRTAWREYKRQTTGQDWDYDFRRLFFTWCPDVRKAKFEDWIEISNAEANGGQLLPGDLWVAADGAVHIVWEERSLDERLRRRFFPSAVQRFSIQYAVIRNGKLQVKKPLIQAVEGESEIPSYPRFHVLPDQRLLLVWYVARLAHDGTLIGGLNRLVELRGPEMTSAPTTMLLPANHSCISLLQVRAGGLRRRTSWKCWSRQPAND